MKDDIIRVPQEVKVVFFTGFRGSGKTTAAEMLSDYLARDGRYTNKVDTLPFVNIVKDRAAHLFNVDPAVFYETSLKDKTLQQWPFDTPRNLLLKIADTLLHVWPDIWVHPWKIRARQHLQKGNTLIVPDLRMMQEWSTVLTIRSHWGIDTHIVRVRKPKEVPVGPTTHITERFINDFSYDHCIVNDGTLNDLKRDVYRIYLNIFKPETLTLQGDSNVDG